MELKKEKFMRGRALWHALASIGVMLGGLALLSGCSGRGVDEIHIRLGGGLGIQQRIVQREEQLLILSVGAINQLCHHSGVCG